MDACTVSYLFSLKEKRKKEKGRGKETERDSYETGHFEIVASIDPTCDNEFVNKNKIRDISCT